MRGVKSLVSAALIRRGLTALTAAGAASAVLVHAAPALADTPANHVRDVKVRATDEGTVEIDIVGTGAPAYSVRVADGGHRLLVDLSDADVAGAPAAITTAVGVVGGVLTQGFDTAAGHMTRLTISLARTATYRVLPGVTGLKLILTPSGPARARRICAAGASPAEATSAPRPAALVRDVRFERAPSTAEGCAPYGCDRVIVDLGAIPAYSLSTSSSGRPRLELKSTALPETLARTLDVTSFGGALKSVTASYDAATAATRLELDRASEASGTISVEGGAIVWSFPVLKRPAQPSPIAMLHIDGRAADGEGPPCAAP